MGEKRYYKIIGGKALLITVAFFDKRKAQLEARADIKKEFGAKGEFSNENGIRGLVFDTPPNKWIHDHGSVYKPPLTKDGKELRKRLRSLKVDGASEFHHAINGDQGGMGFMEFSDRGMVICYVIPERIGDSYVLIVPDDTEDARQWNPPDSCERIKTSEYWQLKEAQPNNLCTES